MSEPVRIVCLPGDGIGPEVMREAERALSVVLPDAELDVRAIGVRAIEQFGDPLPAATLEACQAADAVLMGAVGSGGYAWNDTLNPEEGIFRLRRGLDVYANLRPFRHGEIDLLIVRELVGGLYFGARGTRADGTVYDTCEYHPTQVERVVRKAFALARARGRRLTSVDKANVLATSRMWRAIVSRVAEEHPDVAVDHLLVDTAALHLVREPERFDVIVTENTFGDILSDVAAGVAGGLEIAPSASLGDANPGLFEPVHGTAPDIAGSSRANPAAMLLSLALMLRYGLGRDQLATTVEDRVYATLDQAAQRGDSSLSTEEFGERVAEGLGVAVSEPRG